MKVVLVSCVKTKLKLNSNQKVKAKELYTSTLFKEAWIYSQQLKADKTYILSAKYGLLNPETKIGTYNETLNDKKACEIRKWGTMVLKQMNEEGLDTKRDTFILLAGQNYCKGILKSTKQPNGIENFKMPYKENHLKGNGYIVQFLQRKNKHIYDR